MLETIYEVDENIILDENDDDSSKIPNQPSRLAYYICLCMITVCFFTLTLLIAISLNPFLLSNQPIHKSSKFTRIHSDDKLTLSTNIIKHLNIFSHQINDQLNLQSNTITIFTSTISNSSLKNSSSLLWIYTHLKYSQLCIDNNKCKEYFHLKLKKSFTKLSDSLTTIEIISHPRKEIQLDSCSLIQNSTSAILVSLVSIRTINQSEMLDDRINCQNINQDTVLLQKIDKIIQRNKLNDQKLPNMIDLSENDDQTSLTCINPTDCLQSSDNNYHREPTIHSPNDFPQMWNSF